MILKARTDHRSKFNFHPGSRPGNLVVPRLRRTTSHFAVSLNSLAWGAELAISGPSQISAEVLESAAIEGQELAGVAFVAAGSSSWEKLAAAADDEDEEDEEDDDFEDDDDENVDDEDDEFEDEEDDDEDEDDEEYEDYDDEDEFGDDEEEEE